jgi:hypothetical protein
VRVCIERAACLRGMALRVALTFDKARTSEECVPCEGEQPKEKGWSQRDAMRVDATEAGLRRV